MQSGIICLTAAYAVTEKDSSQFFSICSRTSQSKLHGLPKFETNKNKAKISNKVMNNTSTNTTSITDTIVNKLESLVTMPVYYLVIAGAVVLLVILVTCCCCKQTVIVDRVKEVEVPVTVQMPVQEPIIIGRLNKAKDMGRKRYHTSSGSEF